MRSDRERLYQPFVEAENVRRLYKLKLLTGRYMTTLINEAVRFYDDYMRGELGDGMRSASQGSGDESPGGRYGP